MSKKSKLLNYKKETKKAYDLYADLFELQFKRHFEKYIIEEADIFLAHLSGKKILDLGSGPGSHAEYFRRKGFEVLCADISEKMVELCRSKVLKAELMDIENLDLEKQSFDGIWVYASLLHIPKEKIPKVIEKLKSALKPHGILAIALKEGKGEKLETHEKYPGTIRFFSYFTKEEIERLLENSFELIRFSKTNVENKYVFLNFLFRLKESKL